MAPKLFHYTSAEACFSILHVAPPRDRPNIWASNAFCMNDMTEIEYGLEVVHRAVQDSIPRQEAERYFSRHHRSGDYTQLTFLQDTCLVSLCADPDLLSQWRAYGKNAAGYAIGFHRECIERNAAEVGFDLIPVVYGRVNQEDTVRAFLARAKQICTNFQQPFWTYVIDNAIHLALGFKNDCFRHEIEWRLISPHPKTILKYRSGRSGVVLYAEIPFEKKCIAEIWQGPTLDYKMTQRAWEVYFEREYGIGQVLIHESQIPLRNV